MPIYVTQPSLPPLAEFIPYLEQIWANKWLTNNGPFHQQFEQALADYLGVEHLSLFSNGTIALVTALKALNITGEVITTPYSFVATAHALLWNGLKPVFADIDPVTLNLDPERIEAAITPATSAILPVHCYGTPCAVESLQRLADRHHLKILYDAAHAFGVRDGGGSLLRHGDLAVLSFHATKVFNTFEGGAIVSPSAEVKRHIDHLKNFGFTDEVTVESVGINGKMNEFQSAFGLLQLQHVDQAIAARGAVAATYRQALDGVPGIRLLDPPAGTIPNHSYFPILIEGDDPNGRDRLYERLKRHGVHTRRYFYPLISSMPMYVDLPSAAPENLPVAVKTANQVLCLPIHANLAAEDQALVLKILTGEA